MEVRQEQTVLQKQDCGTFTFVAAESLFVRIFSVQLLIYVVVISFSNTGTPQHADPDAREITREEW